jgi:hypothetical protein
MLLEAGAAGREGPVNAKALAGTHVAAAKAAAAILNFFTLTSILKSGPQPYAAAKILSPANAISFKIIWLGPPELLSSR